MTQPRKEQINDLRTFYTPINSVGTNHPVSFGVPDVPGGTIQTFQNNSNGQYYLNFLNLSTTGVPGGSESDTPAFFFGNFGPFASPVVAGASFTITLPGINGGNPILITFQSSDSVNINSVPFITTSKAAIRINAALTAAGVNPTTPVAANVNGQLVLTSANHNGYTTGSNAFITVNDVTVGVCSALGFTSTNTAVSTGISSPQRGIITTSDDSQGGYIQLRLLDGSPARTQSPVQINVGGLGNLPLYPAGQRVYGRLQQFPGLSSNPKFVISYYRAGAVPGTIVTNGENCSTILNTDTFTVVVKTTNPALYPYQGINTYTLNISFGSAPLGPQDVINAVNTAWNAAAVGAGFPSGTEAGRGGVSGNFAGPWYFDSNDEFFISFNGQSPINISPGPATLSSQDLVTFINAAISTAGQTAQGQAALAANGSIQITSALTTGSASTVQIYAGDNHDNVAKSVNNYVVTLDKIGISPGIYSGSVIAELYGQDEIQFSCPDHVIKDPYGHATSITVSGSAPVMTKLGLSGTSVTSSTALGIEPVTPTPMQALIPEMMNFGEIPENVETTTGQFQEDSIPLPVSAGTGTGNVGVSPLLGLNGKINPDLISKVFSLLNVETLTLGAGDLGTLGGNATPRIVTPFSNSTTIGLTLIWQAGSVAGLDGANASQIIRLYTDQNGGLWLTNNAVWNGIDNTNNLNWNKDVGGQPATAFYIGQSNNLNPSYGPQGTPQVSVFYDKASNGPFSFNGPFDAINYPPIGIDPSGSSGGAQAYFQSGTGNTADALIPRLLAHSNNSTYTLIWQSFNPNGGFPLTRVYSFTNSTESYYQLTVNAMWNGTTWQKDVNGYTANAMAVIAANSDCSYSYKIKLAVNNTPWSDTGWDTTPFSSHLSDGNGLDAIGNSGTGSGVVGTGSNLSGQQGAGLIGIGGGGSTVPYNTYNGAGVVGQAGSGSNSGVIAIGSGNGPGVTTTGGNNAPGLYSTAGGGNNYGVEALGSGTSPGVYAQGDTAHVAPGVFGQGTNGGIGVIGSGDARADLGIGVQGLGQGTGTTGYGVQGIAQGSHSDGVNGQGAGNGAGVSGQGGASGVGVVGTGGANNAGVVGNGGTGNSEGVSGVGTGTGTGVTGAGGNSGGVGVSGFGVNGGTGVTGSGDPRSSGAGMGVQGFGQGTGTTGYGVQGIAQGTDSAGGNFQGIGIGHGVEGIGGATGNTGDGNFNSAGVYGQGGGGNSYGVYGKGAGNAAGVYGTSSVTDAPGGEFKGGPGGIGVLGQAGNGNAIGVQGNGTGGGPGVLGNSGSSAPGVWGFAVNGSNQVGTQGSGDGTGAGVLGIGGANGGVGIVGKGAAANSSNNGDGGLFDGFGTGNGADFNVNGGSYNSSVWNHSLSGGVGRPLAANVNTGPIHVETRSYVNSDGNPGKNNIWADNICQCYGIVTSLGGSSTDIGFIANGQAYNVASGLVSSSGIQITMNNSMDAYPYMVLCQQAASFPVSGSSSFYTARAFAVNNSTFFIKIDGVDPTSTQVSVSFIVMGPA